MARKTAPIKASVSLSPTQARAAIPKIKRRLAELSSLNINELNEESGGHILDSHTQKINSTIREIYGTDSIEYAEYSVSTFQPEFMVWFSGMDDSLKGNIETVKNKVGSGAAKLKTLLEILEEQIDPVAADGQSKILLAYNGLDLHPEISRAATRLYLDGHYANAVEAAVKALNGLVRLRSNLEHDGTTLMERAFSPSNPVLRFNELQDQSDKDEQKGFMQLFSGAVSGLRNPRAHGFIHDSPERALEFIAFVSLLAKLLDEAT
ncbi:TIGR02391 family protein [Tardiphaga sp. P5_C10]